MSDHNVPTEPQSLPSQSEALEVVGRELWQLLPDGCIGITYEGRFLAPNNESTVVAFTADRQVIQPQPPFFALSDAVKQLRAAMYRPGTGTWYSAMISVNREGTIGSKFNYDSEPKWLAPKRPHEYVSELEAFPRDPEHVPDWFAAKLAEAGGVDDERHD